MTTTFELQSEHAFIAALRELYNLNDMLYDYWLSELCGDGEVLLAERLTADNLQRIEHDVLEQSLIS